MSYKLSDTEIADLHQDMSQASEWMRAELKRRRSSPGVAPLPPSADISDGKPSSDGGLSSELVFTAKIAVEAIPIGQLV